jgi:hypothetical protein
MQPGSLTALTSGAWDRRSEGCWLADIERHGLFFFSDPSRGSFLYFFPGKLRLGVRIRARDALYDDAWDTPRAASPARLRI